MSYEDLEEARAKRDAKEAATSIGKRGRKRKSPPAQGAVARKSKKGRRSELEVAEDEIAAAARYAARVPHHCVHGPTQCTPKSNIAKPRFEAVESHRVNKIV